MGKFSPFLPNNNFEESEIVLTYFDGITWKIVFLKDIIEEKTFGDYFYDKKIKKNITITFCPKSFAAIVYFGKLTEANEYKNNNIIIKDGETLIQQLTGQVISRPKNGIPENQLRLWKILIC